MNEDGSQSELSKQEREREYKRAWRERNAEHIAAYRATYRADHLDEIRQKNREGMRERGARERAERERRDAARRSAAAWYAANRDRHIETQRRYQAEKKAQDPDAFRASSRERMRRWREKNREEQNAKLRAKHRNNPEINRERAARYRAAHGEEQRAKRRERYHANREEELARQRRWREREKRRIAVGLPPRRLHRLSADERSANRLAADTFFGREWSAEELEAAMTSLRTPTTVFFAWKRDCDRARAAFRERNDPSAAERLRKAAERRADADRQRVLLEPEEARLDAIARELNDRLRTQPRIRRPSIPDPSAPHTGFANPQGGLGL